MNPNKMTNNRDKFHRNQTLNASFHKVEAGADAKTDQANLDQNDLDDRFAKKVETIADGLLTKAATLKKQAKTNLHHVGDLLEEVGDRLKKVGLQRVGTLVHTVGDKIEHMIH